MQQSKSLADNRGDSSGLTGRKFTDYETKRIVEHLTRVGFYAWRQNVLPIPVARAGQVVGFRAGSMPGLPDVIAISTDYGGVAGGKFFGVEVKTGKDKLREVQTSFIDRATARGAIIFVAHSYDDFITQFADITGVKQNLYIK